MRNLGRLFLALTLLFRASSAFAETPEETKVHAVITQQLEALRRGDSESAFARASPTIQGIFQNAQNFSRMVETGFPQIYKSRTHRFLKLEGNNGTYTQRVLIESDGGTVVVRYEIIEIDGASRINGCVIEASQGA